MTDYQITPAGAARGKPGLPGVNAVPTDQAVAAYAADPTSALYTAWAAAVDTQVAEAAETHTPGIQLGYAERNTTFTTAANAAITGLSVTITGNGRPIDIDLYLPAVWHSVANTWVSARIRKAGVQVQQGGVISQLTSAGPTLMMRHTETIAVGVSATFDVQLFMSTAGTITSYGAANAKMLLSAVSR